MWLLFCDVDFARACEQSTDFHFASLEHQFEVIGECLLSARHHDSKPVTMATAAVADTDVDKMSTRSSASSASDDVCAFHLSSVFYMHA